MYIKAQALNTRLSYHEITIFSWVPCAIYSTYNAPLNELLVALLMHNRCIPIQWFFIPWCDLIAIVEVAPLYMPWLCSGQFLLILLRLWP